MSFINDDDPLYAAKTNLRPLPSTASATNYAQASDFNTLANALQDVRTAITAGKGFGFTELAAVPSVPDMATFLWFKDTGQLYLRRSGVDTQINGGGGGGSTLTAAYAAGASQTDSIFALDSTRKGLLIRDNATPIATTNGGLFSVQDSAGSTDFIHVDPRGLRVAQTATTGTTPRLLFAQPAAHTALTAAQELNNFYISSSTVQWTGGGSFTNQRFSRFGASTITFTTGTTITNAATLAIEGAPIASTNATITNAYALWVQAGLTSLDGSLKTPSIGTSAAALHALPTGTGDLVSTDATQALTNKTITAPVFSGTATGTWNIGGTPTATSTILASLGTSTLSSPWTAVTYSGAWVDIGGSTTPSSYAKNATCWVYLRIGAISGVNGTTMFVLPSGFRPAKDMLIPCYVDGGNTTNANWAKIFASTGEVKPLQATTGNLGVGGWAVFLAEA